jgi:hypothetical protein
LPYGGFVSVDGYSDLDHKKSEKLFKLLTVNGNFALTQFVSQTIPYGK